MATVNCTKCRHKFNPSNYMVKGGGAAAGAAAGAWLGAGLGIVGGPLGAIAGTIPGAVVGGALGYLGISKFARCPSCSKVFTI
jgi:hypothetical protein